MKRDRGSRCGGAHPRACWGTEYPPPEAQFSRSGDEITSFAAGLSGGHDHRPGHLPHRADSRPSTASSATVGTSGKTPRCGFGSRAIIWSAGEKLWEVGAARTGGVHAVPRCSGGTTCTPARTTAVTPRPLYPADGGKVFDIHTQPADDSGRDQAGVWESFPFPAFWGPRAGIDILGMDRRLGAVDRASGEQPGSESRSICRTSTTVCRSGARELRRSRSGAASRSTGWPES